MSDERGEAQPQGDPATPTPLAGYGESTPPPPPAELARRERSMPLAFVLAAVAILSVSIIFASTMLIFTDLFRSAATVTSALGSVFTLIGTVSGAYFGIKVASDTVERSVDAIEEANQRAERAYQLANRTLAEMEPQTARRMLTSGPELDAEAAGSSPP